MKASVLLIASPARSWAALSGFLLHPFDLEQLLGVHAQDVRTVLETDFGQPVCDINYFHSLPGPAEERVYCVCSGTTSHSSAT